LQVDQHGAKPAEREHEAALRLIEAAESDKCHACGTMHSVVLMLEDEPAAQRSGGELAAALETGRGSLARVEINCRGCEPCLSMAALKAARGMTG
jgi:hypothetical protein